MTIGTKEPRPEKVQAVEELKSSVAQASLVMLVDYQGLDVKTLSGIRNKLQTAGAEFQVIKNTIFQRAVAGSPIAILADDLKGATAVAFATDDVVAAAKTILEFTKGPKAISVKHAVLDGVVMNASQIEALSKVPSRPELYAMVVGGLQSPITNLVGTLQSLYGQFVMTLQAVSDQKSAQA